MAENLLRKTTVNIKLKHGLNTKSAWLELEKASVEEIKKLAQGNTTKKDVIKFCFYVLFLQFFV